MTASHALSRRAAMAGLAMLPLVRPSLAQGAQPHVVVIGGGVAGATCARALVRRGVRVTLVEQNRTFTACPFSNLVIAGLRSIEQQQFDYDGVARDGVQMAFATATGVDVTLRRVSLSTGDTLEWDRLVVAPGVDLRWDGLPGYDEAASARLPHAWKAGEQTLLLRRQLEAMDDGGVVLMSIPANPYRCPPGPYERASLIAHFLKTRKPKSKLILLDAKDTFSKQRLFQSAWAELYGANLEWVGLSKGGKVTSVDAGGMLLRTEFGQHRGAVLNVIPPQRAAAIAGVAGVADRSGWCPIDPVTFESRLQPRVHVLGDAAIAGAMPKSAFAANAQAKACALAIAALFAGRQPAEPRLINTCYSVVAPDYGITVAGVYRPANGLLADIEGAGGVSALHAPASVRKLEADYADGWFNTITADVFG